jgi:alkylhydroperoxidase/carboxymuconolactone decarboxylase family protein YurZ
MSEDRSTASIRAVLEGLRDGRGYLLPHHGPMAAALPDLHAAYRAMYRALTLDRRHLAELERECVWVALLAALGEAVGTHHIRAFRAAGGDDAMAGALFRLGAWAIGAEEHRFLDAGWARHFPGFDPVRSYLDGAAALGAAALPGPTARLALCAIHAARGNQWALRVELEAAYAEAVPEPMLAEALSLVIWPRGVNPFVRAAETWLDLLRSGRVQPTPPFAAWRDTADQGALPLDE